MMYFCTAKWVILSPVCMSGEVIQLARASISGLFKKEMQTKENVMQSEGKEAVLQEKGKENKC